MPRREQIIANALKSIEIAIQANKPFATHVKTLIELEACDSFFTVSGVTYTLLMYFCKVSQLDQVQTLLKTNKINRLLQNNLKQTALAVALFAAFQNQKYPLEIIDELLTSDAVQQVEIAAKGGTPLFLCVVQKRLDLIKKLTAVNSVKQFLTLENQTTSSLYYAVESKANSVINELLQFIPEQQLLFAINNQLLPIHCAAGYGNLDLVKLFLSYENIAQQQLAAIIHEQKLTVAGLAISSNNFALVEWLFTTYPQLLSSVQGPAEDTLLHHAVKLPGINLKIVEFLLSKRGTKLLTTPNNAGIIPLGYAVANADEIVIQALLKEEALPQLSYTNKVGQGVLSGAIYTKRQSILNLCLTRMMKENPVIGEQVILTPYLSHFLIYAAINADKEIEETPFINTVLKFSPKQQLTKKDSLDRTPLRFAIEENNSFAVKSLLQHLAAHDLLQTELLYTPKLGITHSASSLYFACDKGLIKIVKLLLEHYPQPQLALRYNGFLPIHIAAQRGHLAILIALTLIAPDLIHSLTESGYSTLHLSVIHKQPMITKVLLSNYHLDRMQPDREGNLALHIACEGSDSEPLTYFLKEQAEKQLNVQNKSGYTPFDGLLRQKKLKLIASVIKILGANAKIFLNTLNALAFSHLYNAVQVNSLDICQLFIAEGADVNQACTSDCFTPLYLATQYGRSSLVDLLIAKKANIHALTSTKLSILHNACEVGHVELVKKFITLGVNLEQEDKFGRTPLWMAVIFSQVKVIELLCQNGAKLTSIKTKPQAISVLVFAVLSLDLAAFKILLKYQFSNSVSQNDISAELISTIQSLKDSALIPLFNEALAPYLIEKTPDPIKSSPTLPITHVIEEKGISGRQYLMQMGFSIETLTDFEAECEERCSTLKNTPILPTAPDPVTHYWFKQQFSSLHPAIHSIINSQQAYIYLDENSLEKQGCTLTDLKYLQFKFSHRHIKKLKDTKGYYAEYISCPDGERMVHYTHELKINALDRILLFECLADDKSACLYVGAKFIATGFHVNWRAHALQESIATTKNALKIVWPQAPIQDLVSIEQKQTVATISSKKDNLKTNSAKLSLFNQGKQTIECKTITSTSTHFLSK